RSPGGASSPCNGGGRGGVGAGGKNLSVTRRGVGPHTRHNLLAGHAMSRTRWVRGRVGAGILGLAVCVLAAVPLPGGPPAAAQGPAAGELPVELRYVPPDAALFVHADAAAVWDRPVVKSIRTADAKMFDELAGMGKEAFGLTPDDVKTVVAFAPKLKEPRDLERVGVVVTFKKAYDKDKIKKGAEK